VSGEDVEHLWAGCLARHPSQRLGQRGTAPRGGSRRGSRTNFPRFAATSGIASLRARSVIHGMDGRDRHKRLFRNMRADEELRKFPCFVGQLRVVCGHVRRCHRVGILAIAQIISP
jgi:hypothetical protein